ncbi:MAG: glycoside hydrolase family 172 protein [Phycisphaerae bacterium]
MTRSLLRVALGLALLRAVSPPPAAGDALTQADLLERLVALDRLMLPPLPGETAGFFAGRGATPTTAAAATDAADATPRYLRSDPDGWDVVAEVTGPGVLTRIWADRPSGQMRIVLDGETVIDEPFASLFTGAVPPFAAPLVYETANEGGHVCYFPIGFATRVKLMVKDSASAYHVSYTTFGANTAVTTFSKTLDEAAQAALAETAETLADGYSQKQLFGGRKLMPVMASTELRKGATVTETLAGPGVIRALYVNLADRRAARQLYTLHRCILRITFDDQKRPAVEAPLVDFFGCGFNPAAFRALPIGTDGWLDVPAEKIAENKFMYCLFPMPFQKSAKLEIENLSDAHFDLTYYLRVERAAPPKGALQFNARYRRDDPCKTSEFRVLETSGRGRLVGVLLNTDCPRESWWGDGPEKLTVDGDAARSFAGVDTAAFFGDTAPLHASHGALHGVTNVGPFGKHSAYRWLLADSVPFHKSIALNFENRQVGNRRDVYYGGLAYWYGEPGAADHFKPLKADDVTPPTLVWPGASEIEGNVPGQGWGHELTQRYAGAVEFSNGAAVMITSREWVTINVPSKKVQKVSVALRVHPRRPFGTIEIEGPNKSPAATLTYARENDGLYQVGEADLQKGDNAFRVRVSQDTALDCWVIRER